MKRAWLIALVGALVAFGARAQTVVLAPEGGGLAVGGCVSTGFERAVLPLSVSAAVGFAREGRAFVVGGSFTLPLLRADLSDQRSRLFVSIDLVPTPGWQVRVGAGVSLLSTTNDVFAATALGAELSVLAGYSTRRWLLGVEVVGGPTVATVLTTSEWARRIGNTSFTSGVRWLPAWELEAGVRGGLLVGPVELSLRLGWDRKGPWSLAIPPVYAIFGVGLRWPLTRAP
jgi:hypothetical protein